MKNSVGSCIKSFQDTALWLISERDLMLYIWLITLSNGPGMSHRHMISLICALLELRVAWVHSFLHLSERVAQHSAGFKLRNGALTNNDAQCPDKGALRLLAPHYSRFCELVSRVKKPAARTVGLNRPAVVKGLLVLLTGVFISTHRQKELGKRISCHWSIFFFLLSYFNGFGACLFLFHQSLNMSV